MDTPPPRSRDPRALRYATHAIPALIDEMERRGARRTDLVAEIYGGGAVVSTLSQDFAIGEVNIEAARRGLADFGIAIVAGDTGGTIGRKIILRLPEKRVQVKYVAQSQKKKKKKSA
jgi:chemotaxis protein CheD